MQFNVVRASNTPWETPEELAIETLDELLTWADKQGHPVILLQDGPSGARYWVLEIYDSERE